MPISHALEMEYQVPSLYIIIFSFLCTLTENTLYTSKQNEWCRILQTEILRTIALGKVNFVFENINELIIEPYACG